MSIFGSLTTLAQQVEPDGVILSDPMLTLCRQIVPVIEKFGTSFMMIKTDINGNIDRLEAARQRNPTKFVALFDIVNDELERGKTSEKYSDARGLLWLKRAMEFLDALLSRLYDDRGISLSSAASEVYHDTLYRFHTWYTAAAFQLALKFVPSREKFFDQLEATSEQAMVEMNAFVRAFDPVLAEIERYLKDHGLDDQTPV